MWNNRTIMKLCEAVNNWFSLYDRCFIHKHSLPANTQLRSPIPLSINTSIRVHATYEVVKRSFSEALSPLSWLFPDRIALIWSYMELVIGFLSHRILTRLLVCRVSSFGTGRMFVHKLRLWKPPFSYNIYHQLLLTRHEVEPEYRNTYSMLIDFDKKKNWIHMYVLHRNTTYV